MEIKEVQKLRAKAENQMAEILFDFMDETECAVSDIYMEAINVSAIGERLKLAPVVKIKVQL